MFRAAFRQNGDGADGTGAGTYELSGDAAHSVGENEYVGVQGSGAFTQRGGTHTVGSTLRLGSQPGSTGTYMISGGSLSVGALEVGPQGPGTLDLEGSAAHVTVTGPMKFGPLGSMSAVSGSTVDLAGDWDNASTTRASSGSSTARRPVPSMGLFSPGKSRFWAITCSKSLSLLGLTRVRFPPPPPTAS
jgi:T5SS/PEP-CTERM-associated repeat protein